MTTNFDRPNSFSDPWRSPRRSHKHVGWSGEILTLAEAKQELGIFDTGDTNLDAKTDADVAALIQEAREWCEQQTARTLTATATRQLCMDVWPKKGVKFLEPPLTGVTSVQYYDSSNSLQYLSATEFIVLAPTLSQGSLVFNDTFTRPDLYDRADAILITYVCGWSDVSAIPARAKRAVKLMLSVYYDNDDIEKSLETKERAARSLLNGLDWGDYV